MKIRNGFVSNSSSSSFVALVPKIDWQSMIATMSPIEQAAVESLSGDTTFCGIECVDYACNSGNDDSLEYADWDKIRERAKELAAAKGITLPEEDLEDDSIRSLAYDASHKLKSEIRKLGKKAYTCTQDW
jgi:hypothetical protein